MNKKGFTLIELLAVIVILAIIVVIAVPQIIRVIDGSRQSAWKENVVLIKKSLEIDYSANNLNAATSSTNCNNKTNFQNKLFSIADIDETSTNIKSAKHAGSTCTIVLEAKGQFDNANNSDATLACTEGKCTITW